MEIELKLRYEGYEGETTWNIQFPLSDLGQAIALFGWMWANDVRQQYQDNGEVMTEFRRLDALEALDIPDPRWFYEHAQRIS